MSLSTGTRNLFIELGGWVGAACLVAVALANYDELKSLAAGALGAPPLPANYQSGDHPQHMARAEAAPSGDEVRLKASRHGHFFAEADINGRSVDVMVDTGASLVAMTYEDAERAGVYLNFSDFTHRVNTANGVARVAPVTLDSVRIGNIEVRNVRAAVSEPGRMNVTLLGMSFLSQIDRVDMRQGELILED